MIFLKYMPILLGLFVPLIYASAPSYVALLSVGPSWANSGKTQTLTLQPNLVKTYSADQGTQIFLNGELFLGIQHTIYEKMKGVIGFVVAGNGIDQLSGNVWEDADPAFNNYRYTYRLNQLRIGAEARLIGQEIEKLINYSPFVSASLGLGFNHAYHFTLTPKIFEEVVSPPFNNATTTALSYTLGVGVQKKFSEHWHLGIGYEFADWGKSMLKPAQSQSIGNGLALSHLYTNGLQLLFNYQS